MEKPVLLVKKLVNDIDTVKYQTEGAAGIDLHSAVDITLCPGDIEAIPTGIKLEIPGGWEVQIRGRSGLAFKHYVFVTHLGTIDSDYRGEIFVMLENKSQHVYAIRKNDRIGQMVLKPAPQAKISIVAEISDSERGEKGFGSTGK